MPSIHFFHPHRQHKYLPHCFTKSELMEMDKKHFLHSTSNVKQCGRYLCSRCGWKKCIEGMSSLWNVNIGYGRKELVEVAKEQIENLSFNSTFSTYSNEPAIKLAAKSGVDNRNVNNSQRSSNSCKQS